MPGSWIAVSLNGINEAEYLDFLNSLSSSVMAVPSPSNNNVFAISVLDDDWELFLGKFFENSPLNRISVMDVETAIVAGAVAEFNHVDVTVDADEHNVENSLPPQTDALINRILDETASLVPIEGGGGNIREEVEERYADDVGEVVVNASTGAVSNSEVNKKVYGAAPVKTAVTKSIENQITQDICKIDNYSDKLVLFASFLLGTAAGGVVGLRNDLIKIVKERSMLLAALSKQRGKLLLGKAISSSLKEVENKVRESLSDDSVFNLCAEVMGSSKEELMTSFLASFEGFKRVTKNVAVDSIDIVNKLASSEMALYYTANLIVSTLSKESEIVIEKAREMLDIILEYPFVNKVEVTQDGKFVVFYDDVVIRHDNLDWDLGEFRFSIELDKIKECNNQYSMLFEIKNMSVLTSQQHPHIVSEGRSICWGNIKEGVYKLMADGNFPVLVSLVWNYLHSYNPSDRFICIEDLFRQWQRTPRKIISDVGEHNG